MACCRPKTIENPNYDKTGKYGGKRAIRFYEVPCGHCINCLVDKRNSLEDRCKQELLEKKTGVMVTLTYDDIAIIKNETLNAKGELVATLCYKDIQDFLKRLRITMKRKNIDFSYLQKDFTYVVVGEYGENGQKFERPHWHLLIFGFNANNKLTKELLQHCWKWGIIDVGNIRRGGIRYVLKYLDKQLSGSFAELQYDANNVERPKLRHSTGLGKNLYVNQVDYIRKHNGRYQDLKHKEKPAPKYYLNKLGIKTIPDYTRMENELKTLKIKPVKNLHEYANKRLYSVEQIQEWKKSKAITKEKIYIAKMKQEGIKVEDYRDDIDKLEYENDIFYKNIALKYKRNLEKAPTRLQNDKRLESLQ